MGHSITTIGEPHLYIKINIASNLKREILPMYSAQTKFEMKNEKDQLVQNQVSVAPVSVMYLPITSIGSSDVDITAPATQEDCMRRSHDFSGNRECKI